MRVRTFAVLCLLLLCFNVSVSAMNAHEQMEDMRLEAIARQIAQELYCPVCAGQTIDDSQAPLAKTLRAFIRQRLREGADRDTIHHDLVARFGESILLEPRDRWLWIVPWLLIGLVTIGISVRWWQRSSKGING
ncbi:MAG: cytochrome c-type biogenesis protein [Alphaproteobacteria bacterium]